MARHGIIEVLLSLLYYFFEKTQCEHDKFNLEKFYRLKTKKKEEVDSLHIHTYAQINIWLGLKFVAFF